MDMAKEHRRRINSGARKVSVRRDVAASCRLDGLALSCAHRALLFSSRFIIKINSIIALLRSLRHRAAHIAACASHHGSV